MTLDERAPTRRYDYLDRLLSGLGHEHDRDDEPQGYEHDRDLILRWYALHTLETIANPRTVCDLRASARALDNHQLHGLANELRDLANHIAAVVAPTRSDRPTEAGQVAGFMGEAKR